MEKSTVATMSRQVESMQADWALASALLGGTRSMRAAGKKYLPQFPKEDDESYAKRLGSSVLFPAYKRTVSTLSGKPFSKPITVDEAPDQIEEWLEDCDLQGRNLHAFASDVFQAALGYGLAGILVEYPVTKVEEGAAPLTQAQEKERGIRPYFVELKCDHLLGWKVARIGVAWRLTQLRFFEFVEEDETPYTTKVVQQVRVLNETTWETHRQNDKKEWVLHDSGINTLGVVPFVPVYGERCEFMQSRPPLIEVAHLNVAHWQSASDQQNILHVARVPILAATGVDDTYSLVVGAQAATKLPQGADLKFVEHGGKAIEAGAKDLADLEERMRQAGAELLVIDTKLTATQVNTENAVGMCALQRTAEAFEDALDYALDLMARWAKLDRSGHVTLFKDFAAATLAEASAKLLLDMNLAGKISDETLHTEMQRRGILAPDINWEAERERLSNQGPGVGGSSDDDQTGTGGE